MPKRRHEEVSEDLDETVFEEEEPTTKKKRRPVEFTNGDVNHEEPHRVEYWLVRKPKTVCIFFLFFVVTY